MGFFTPGINTYFMNRKRVSKSVLSVMFYIVLLHMFACTKGSNPGPDLSIQDASQVRGSSEANLRFHLTLSKPAETEVSVSFSLIDGTAKSPGDFASVTGTVIIPANGTEGIIDVPIKGDPLNVRQPNLQFTVQLSNPKNCTMSTVSATGTIITEDGSYLSTDNTGYSTPSAYPGYSLVWSDEFSGNNLDQNTWNQELGNGSGGWGNNELESYTSSPRNVFVSNGNLIIEARRETIGAFNYSSARLTTQDKKAFKFGRIDIRAKLPVGKGIWPALWMLGSNISSAGWPSCGEIDIMELIGINPSTVYGTLHWSNGGLHASKGSSKQLLSGDYSKEFHVFSIIWVQNSIQWLIDDQKYLEVSVSDVGATNYPFNADQFFIFNVAVGGNWPGAPDNTTEFPERMFVDYVRVFQ
jgi:beta-glucanase (GH16 family)